MQPISTQLKHTFIVALLLAVAMSAAVALPGLTPTAQAQEPEFDQINEIAHELNCPTCTGINLADCRTQTCAQWKDQIGDLLAQGYTQDEVLDYFVNQYGTQVLQAPPKSGFTLTLWVLPVTMIVLGGLLLFFTLRKWTTSQQTAPAVAPAGSPAVRQPNGAAPAASNDDYLSQVEKDLEY